MPEASAVLTPLHYLYFIGAIAILAAMVLHRDTPPVCIAFLFLFGLVGLNSISGGVMTIFNAILYTAREFMGIITTVALVTALTQCFKDLGSDLLIMKPMSRIMKGPAASWWTLSITMMVFSLFLWPSPSVALVGAVMLPYAIKSGLTPMAAAMAMNLSGHGFALSYDFIIQGAPAITAAAAGITTQDLLIGGRPVFLVMGAATVLSAYVLNRKTITGPNQVQTCCRPSSGPQMTTTRLDKNRQTVPPNAALILAVLLPAAFAADVIAIRKLGLEGENAAGLISGTSVLLTCVGTYLGINAKPLEKITEYITNGFISSIRLFAPLILIGSFFLLGGEGMAAIMGKPFQGSLLRDWAISLTHDATTNKYLAAFLQLAAGCLTGLDGSGFSGLPLTGSLAQALGLAAGASVPVLAALGQIAAVFVGGGAIVPWGIIPVAAICRISPIELARRNLLPVIIGFICTFCVACFLL